MKWRSGIVLLILILGTSAVYGQEQATNEGKYKIEAGVVSDVVAIVNNKQITTKELFERLYKLYGQQVLNQMINELLVRCEAEKQQIKVSSDEITTEIDKIKNQFADEKSFINELSAQGMAIEDLKNQIELQLLTKKLLIKDKDLQVTDSEIKAYFDENQDKFATPEQIRISHILVNTEQEAKDLIIALQAGADFKLLARAKSMDQTTKDKGGEIGFVSRGNLVPEFEKAAFSLRKPGDISNVVKTQFGYHVIRLEEKRPSQPAKFNQETQDKIKELLLQQKLSQALPSWLQELHNKAVIKKFWN